MERFLGTQISLRTTLSKVAVDQVKTEVYFNNLFILNRWQALNQIVMLFAQVNYRICNFTVSFVFLAWFLTDFHGHRHQRDRFDARHGRAQHPV